MTLMVENSFQHMLSSFNAYVRFKRRTFRHEPLTGVFSLYAKLIIVISSCCAEHIEYDVKRQL